MSITSEHPEYVEMSRHWTLVDDLLTGTLGFRAKGAEYLPRVPNETDDHYNSRLALAYLDPAYEQALDNYVGRAFSSEPTITTTLPQDWIENIDLEGTHLAAKMRHTFRDCLNHGITHLLVDSPRGPANMTRADARRNGIRPYIIQIPSKDLFYWKGEYINSKLTLTHVRYWEYREEPVPGDPWTMQVKRFVKVLEPGRWGRYDLEGNLIEGGETGWNYVSLVSANINPVGWMSARPVNESLAWLNLSAYQSIADQRHIVRHSRIPIGVFEGLMNQDPVTISPGMALILPPGATFRWAETTGGPAAVGDSDIRQLEKRMDRLALEPLLPSSVSGDRTATEALLGDLPVRSKLESCVLLFKDAWENALSMLADIGGQADDTSIDMKGNFALPASSADIVNLQQDQAAGRISLERYLTEGKRRNYLSDDLDVDAEISATEDQRLLGQSLQLDLNTDTSPDGTE